MAVNLRQERNGGMSLVGRGARRVANFMPENRGLNYMVGQVARTELTAKTIGYIPAGGIPVSFSYHGVANSDAVTTGVLSVGHALGTEFLSAVSVKANSVNQTSPAAGAALGAVLSATADTPITALYAETGGAATTGGPWTIIIGYYMPA